MSHIESFRIDGLAGRKEPLDLVLNRDTNIIFGLNGSGKTSLLKILHAAMYNETDNLRTVPFTAAEVRIYSITWNTVFTRSIKKPKLSSAARPSISHIVQEHFVVEGETLVTAKRSRDDELVWRCTPSKPAEASSTRWGHRYLPTSRLHISDEASMSDWVYSGRSSLTEENLDAMFARAVDNLWSSYSAQVLGEVRTAQQEGLASVLRAVLSTDTARRKRRKSKLTPRTAYARVHNFLDRQGSASILGTQESFEVRYNADRTLYAVVQDIDAVEDKVESAMASRNKLEELIVRMFTGSTDIRFTDKAIEVYTESGDEIGLSSLSSGEQHVLRIFVETLLVGVSSLMIDEPELSMHVDWQKDLIHSLRTLNKSAQLIFATHSPEILADVPDDKIFRI